MELTYLIALSTGILIAMLIFLAFQVYSWKQAEQQRDDDEMLARMIELAEYHAPGESLADTAIRVARQRKDAQRRARQRKANKRKTS